MSDTIFCFLSRACQRGYTDDDEYEGHGDVYDTPLHARVIWSNGGWLVTVRWRHRWTQLRFKEAKKGYVAFTDKSVVFLNERETRNGDPMIVLNFKPRQPRRA